jgi:hypothetical protein
LRRKLQKNPKEIIVGNPKENIGKTHDENGENPDFYK